MIVSIYKYILYKLQRLVAGQYLDDLSFQIGHLHSRVEEHHKNETDLAEQLTAVQYKLKHTEGRATEYSSKLDSALQRLHQDKVYYTELLGKKPPPEKVWVMDTKMFTEFCKEFEPPIINHQNTPTDAAFRLGIQRVLSRIGEKHVGR